MKAIVFDGELKYRTDYPRPFPAPGESLIRVIMAGVCNTDVELTRGYMNFSGILGHEFVGIVEESDNRNLIGKRVVGEINCPCHKCSYCMSGMGKHCPDRTVLGIQNRDGVFAQYTLLPDENLHIVPDSVDNETAVFAEPLSAGFEIADSVHIRPTDRVLVMGDGKLGLLCAMALSGTACRLTSLGKHPEKLEILKKAGIDTILLSDYEPDGSFDTVVEATGRAESFSMAMRSVKRRGTIVQKSTYAGNLNMNISELTVNEIRLIGSRCGPFAPALRSMETGRINVKPLISRIMSLNDGVETVRQAMEPGTIKILIRMED